MVEWWEPVAIFLKENSLVIATVVLAGVTGVLVWVTWRLGNITRQTGESANALAVKPVFVFEPVSLYLNGTIETYYFTVRNIGNADALNPQVTATVAGKKITIDIRPKLEFVSPENPLNFDLAKSDVTDDLEITIEFEDIRGKKVEPVKRIFPKESLLQKIQ